MGGYVFTGVCLFTFFGRRGTPILPERGGGVPTSFSMGDAPIHPSKGIPHVQVRSQVRTGEGGTPNRNSKAAGGMPLAFTQEDFLVLLVVLQSEFTRRIHQKPAIMLRTTLKQISVSWKTMLNYRKYYKSETDCHIYER